MQEKQCIQLVDENTVKGYVAGYITPTSLIMADQRCNTIRYMVIVKGPPIVAEALTVSDYLGLSRYLSFSVLDNRLFHIENFTFRVSIQILSHVHKFIMLCDVVAISNKQLSSLIITQCAHTGPMIHKSDSVFMD